MKDREATPKSADSEEKIDTWLPRTPTQKLALLPTTTART